MPRQILASILALVACTLRPYTSDSAGSTTTTATVTSSASSGGTTGTVPLPTTSETTTSETTTTTGPIMGTWRGLYRKETLGDRFPDNVHPDDVFHDCATQQTWQLRGDIIPYTCGTADSDGLWLHLTGVLHPDGDDSDELDELEITEVLADPCLAGACDAPGDWSTCGNWEDSCGAFEDCEVWQQDCPEGQKCMPYSDDGDSTPESQKCVPIAPGAGGVGDLCTSDDVLVTGIDTCAEGHLCWEYFQDNVARCVAQCTGSPEQPACPVCSNCVIAADGVLQVCLPDCSPLLQDCGDGFACVPNPYNPDLLAGFLCTGHIDGGMGQAFAPCEFVDECDPGLWCAPSGQASECDPNAPGCCLPFCDTDNPSCPGVGLQCVPWLSPDQASPCNVNFGSCRLPA